MRRLICLLGLLALQPALAHGQEMIWFSPLTMTAQTTTGLTIRPAPSPQTAIRITAAAPGTFFANLGLSLPTNVLIDNVAVCYQLDNTASFITLTGMSTMKTPDMETVLFDDPTDRNALLECYTVDAGNFAIEGAITLELRLTFTNVNHGIEIGGVAVGTLPNPIGIADPMPAPGAEASSLGQNRPNPFNPSTVIDYELKDAGQVELRIFSAQGRLVRTLRNENALAGSHRAEWDGRDDAGRSVPSGAYYYQLKTGDAEESKPMILLR